MAIARLALAGLDCADPPPLAEFWAALLDGTVVMRTEQVCVVQTDTIMVGTVRVPDYTPPTWPDGSTPKQLHLDLAVRDLDEAEAEALRLGARYLDPAGHPFCLTANIPF
jgi:hypothetical protein